MRLPRIRAPECSNLGSGHPDMDCCFIRLRGPAHSGCPNSQSSGVGPLQGESPTPKRWVFLARLSHFWSDPEVALGLQTAVPIWTGPVKAAWGCHWGCSKWAIWPDLMSPSLLQACGLVLVSHSTALRHSFCYLQVKGAKEKWEMCGKADICSKWPFVAKGQLSQGREDSLINICGFGSDISCPRHNCSHFLLIWNCLSGIILQIFEDILELFFQIGKICLFQCFFAFQKYF